MTTKKSSQERSARCIGQHLVAEWATELSETLGRPAEQIAREGLSAGDFPGRHELCIELADGSRLQFRYAFWVASPDRAAIAVFTEHCGYHVFPSHDTTISHIRREFVYPPEVVSPHPKS